MNQIYNKKTVLITGGSRGVGAATAKEFASHGYNIIINYVENDFQAQNIRQEILSKYDVKVTLVKADVSQEKDIEKMISTIKKEYETIDCLINNAGIAIDTTLEDKTVANFHQILDVNLIGPFLMSKYIGQLMLEQGYGRIVNISSTNGIDSYYPYSMDYDASKAGLISLTHNFAIQYAPHIQVNCVAPGWVNTEMNKELEKEYIAEENKHILLKRFAEPEEIAETIYFAATASYLNDAIIKIDGGRI